MKFYIYTIITVFLFSSCNQNENENKLIQLDFNQKVLAIVKNKNAIISNYKVDIPTEIIGYLSKKENQEFKIGDINDININLGDAKLNNKFEYDKKLNFIVKLNSKYVMVYIQGGIGSYFVINYFNLDKFEFLTTKTLKDISTKEYFIKEIEKEFLINELEK